MFMFMCGEVVVFLDVRAAFSGLGMIHILGAGSIGSLLAVALSRKNAVNMLLKPATYTQYISTGQSTIRIHSPRIGEALWEAELPATPTNKVNEPIKQMIVAVKAYDVAPALDVVKNFITPETEILVMHNGMGVEEKLRQLWPKPSTSPNISFGVTTAGSKRLPPLWTFEYTGNGVNTVSGQGPLIDALVNCHDLVLTDNVPRDRFVIEQKRKLLVNSVINPLTAILQCPNGALPGLDKGDLIRKIVKESCSVLGLDTHEMYDLVFDVIQRTATNISSMLGDIESNRPTEIEFINGYIVKEAKRQNMGALLNSALQNLVNMRMLQTRHELESAIPLHM